MLSKWKVFKNIAKLPAVRELAPRDSPDSISNTSIPFLFCIKNEPKFSLLFWRMNWEKKQWNSYEKSWYLENARLQTLAIATPQYGEILKSTLYNGL